VELDSFPAALAFSLEGILKYYLLPFVLCPCFFYTFDVFCFALLLLLMLFYVASLFFYLLLVE